MRQHPVIQLHLMKIQLFDSVALLYMVVACVPALYDATRTTKRNAEGTIVNDYRHIYKVKLFEYIMCLYLFTI